MNKIERLLLIQNTTKQISAEQLAGLVERLRDGGCTVSVLPENRNLTELLPDVRLIGEEALSSCQAALVLGGDGSIIEASHRLLNRGIPILGINYGHVGYLAALEIGELPLIDRLLSGDCTVDDRMMLDASVLDSDGAVRASYTVLNDAVLSNGPVSRLIQFDIECDGVAIQTCRADGIIAATPTGSTAYSLSAGGPVLDPTLEGICLTPICPHTMSSRPVIFRANSVIRLISIRYGDSSSVYLTADGRNVLPLNRGDTVEIRRSRSHTHLIRIKEGGFFRVLRDKLSENGRGASSVSY